MGDLNSGPTVEAENIVGEFEDNFNTIVADGYRGANTS